MELNDIKLVNQGEHMALYYADYTLSDKTDKRYEFVSRAGARRDGPSSNTVLNKQNFPDPKVRGVIIVTFNPNRNKILLMKEFRPATGHVIYNHPMGLIDPGETAEMAAKRELKEETGLDMTHIMQIMQPSFSSPGLSDQRTWTIITEAAGDITPSTNPNELTYPEWADKNQVKQILNDPNSQFSTLTQMTLFAWCYFNTPGLL